MSLWDSFIYEPDDALLCQICTDVADDPKQHEKCGRLFCKKCLEEYGKGKPCPNCRTLWPKYFTDARSKYRASFRNFPGGEGGSNLCDGYAGMPRTQIVIRLSINFVIFIKQTGPGRDYIKGGEHPLNGAML